MLPSPGERPGARAPRRRLGDYLVERGRITPEQLDEALDHQKRSGGRMLGEVLVDRRLMTQAQLTQDLADLAGRPFLHLTPSIVSPDALPILPADFLERHNLLPLSVTGGLLMIAVERFTDVLLIDEVSRRSGLEVLVVAASPDAIREARAAVLPRAGAEGAPRAGEALSDLLDEIGLDDLEVVEARAEEHDSDLEAGAAESPVVALVNHIIRSGVEAAASDIHIEPGEGSFRVRYRVDGELATFVRPSARMLPAVVSRIKILAGMDISERRHPQDGGVTVRMHDRSVDIRISTMASKFGEKVVMRIVDREAALPSLDDLGLQPLMLARLRALIREPNGIILVTGPTGSGKSTSIYGALGELVSETRNVSTIEDPIERIVPGANQFQVAPKTGLTFAVALRSMLRQDPDVIMVGEVRDAETARLATEAAMTGHLILSTLHTNDAPTAVPRLINMGVEPYLVAASLRAVLAQRLVRRLCPSCAESHALTDEQARAVAALGLAGEGLERACIGAGCPACADSGFRGRIGVYDLLELNESSLSDITADHHAGRAPRLTSAGLVEDGMHKVREGVIGLDALLAIVPRAGAAGDPPRRRRAA